ncbi:MAG TPA: MerR family transcriptional regulator, partial [Thermoanaerobaculia bacterium]|nr:MerR family transcriptional regulator [Thermoanaerobaculia bacterium]
MTEAAGEKRLYKIGEVCRIADVQPYVLRYWETEFPALAPNKSGGGQRLYTQREID